MHGCNMKAKFSEVITSNPLLKLEKIKIIKSNICYYVKIFAYNLIVLSVCLNLMILLLNVSWEGVGGNITFAVLLSGI
jgi:hypothetical protein